jgi:hypothetical protein
MGRAKLRPIIPSLNACLTNTSSQAQVDPCGIGASISSVIAAVHNNVR